MGPQWIVTYYVSDSVIRYEDHWELTYPSVLGHRPWVVTMSKIFYRKQTEILESKFVFPSDLYLFGILPYVRDEV